MKNKYPVVYHGIKPNPHSGVDWSKYEKRTSSDRRLCLRDIFYLDKNQDRQIRTELWETDLDVWYLTNMCGWINNQQDGECISLKW